MQINFEHSRPGNICQADMSSKTNFKELPGMGDKLRIELYIQLQLLKVYEYTQLYHKPSPSVKVPAKTQTVKNII